MNTKNLYYKNLEKKFNSKTATIAVVGLGYVGLPLLIQFYRKGFNCFGIDTDNKKVESFNKNKFDTNYFEDVIKKKRKHSVKKLKKIYFSNNYSLITKADIIIICLPTPVFKNKQPNLQFITSSLKQMKSFLKKGQLISLESTVSPGTTNKILANFLIKENFRLSKDFFLVYSPERENPVIKNLDQKFNFFNTPKICSGYSKECTRLGVLMYSKIIKTVIKTDSIKNAEMSKMIENIYRATNIGLVNELKMLCHKMNLDIHEILKLASTKPFGFKTFTPGPGIGGHCIPVDPHYLIHEAKNYNFDLKFVSESMKTNENITKWCINKIEKIFIKKKINNKKLKILFLGAAYKANIDDLRESPAIKFFKYFSKRKIKFDYCDPHVPKIKENGFFKSSIKLNYNSFNSYSALILLTDHSIFNKKYILKNSKLIIDTRGYFSNYKDKNIYSI